MLAQLNFRTSAHDVRVIFVFLFLLTFAISSTSMADQKAAPGAAPASGQGISKTEVDAKLDELAARLKALVDRIDTQDRRAAAIDQRMKDNLSGIQKAEQDDREKKLELIALQALDIERSTKTPSFWPIIASTIGALLSSVIGGGVAWYVARRITLRLKMIDSTLEFSKRFGELVHQQTALNNAYKTARKNADFPPSELEREEANIWWWRFFDLVLYEFDFFKQGLIWDERFAQWMKWRWHEFHAEGDNTWKTNGVDYRTGWEQWKSLPANHGHRLIRFLDSVHGATDTVAVVSVVRAASPKLWHKYHLER